MASGLVCRANRPNTWLHRPACKREEKPCQLGAVHTWHTAAVNQGALCPQLAEADIRPTRGRVGGVEPRTRRFSRRNEGETHADRWVSPTLNPRAECRLLIT